MLKMKRGLCLILAILLMVSGAFSTSAQDVLFPDVSSDHWATKAMKWGVEHNVLDGYSDGSFAPGKPVTESEFLKMLISAYETLPGLGDHWYDKYYGFAHTHGWYVKGLKNKSFVDQPISRKNAAIILSSALGHSYVDDSDHSAIMAINELYKRDLSHGKTEKTIEGFAPEEYMTRAEAVQFVYNFATQSGLENLKASVSDADWAYYEKVTFNDTEGILDKHKLFAKKYGLQVITYKASGIIFINLVSDSEDNQSEFHISSTYKKHEDSTIEWTLAVDLDKEDPFVAYELLARIFSYDTTYQDSITQKLEPVVKESGIEIDGWIRAEFGTLEIKASYDQETHNYYIVSVVAPEGVEENE